MPESIDQVNLRTAVDYAAHKEPGQKSDPKRDKSYVRLAEIRTGPGEKPSVSERWKYRISDVAAKLAKWSGGDPYTGRAEWLRGHLTVSEKVQMAESAFKALNNYPLDVQRDVVNSLAGKREVVKVVGASGNVFEYKIAEVVNRDKDPNAKFQKARVNETDQISEVVGQKEAIIMCGQLAFSRDQWELAVNGIPEGQNKMNRPHVVIDSLLNGQEKKWIDLFLPGRDQNGYLNHHYRIVRLNERQWGQLNNVLKPQTLNTIMVNRGGSI